MTIDLKQLRYFEAVSRHKSFTRAAREMRIEQPALSQAIKRLEDQLGVKLFSRNSKDVTLHPEAKLLLRRTEKIFAEVQLAKEEMRTAAELRVGNVRIGMPPMYGERYFPALFAAFHATYPEIIVSAHEGGAEEIHTLLESGALDLGMLENRRVPANWASVEVGQDETILAVGEKHALSARTSVTPEDLDGLPMVVFDNTFLQRLLLDQICQAAGVRYRLVMQSNFVPGIRNAVADGMGAATLLRSAVSNVPGLRAIPFDPPEIFHFSLCWPRETELSVANRALVELAVSRFEANHSQIGS